MAENLRYLPNVVGPGTGSTLMPSHYVYDYDGTDVDAAKATSNYNTYGVLYNWTAAVHACPSGWHLPTDDEWTQMENYLADNGCNYDGTTGGAHDKIAKSLAGSNGWTSSSNVGVVGNTDYPAYRNKSGFTALPGGYRNSDELFNSIDILGAWWSNSEDEDVISYAWGRDVGCHGNNMYRGTYSKGLGYSVRCVKD